jgi:UrcA family protein
MPVTNTVLFAAALSVSLAAGSTAALAGEVALNDQGQRTVTVSYSDLNLDTAVGRTVLAARIHNATKTVCGDTDGRVSLTESVRIRTCMRATMDTALAAASIGSPLRLALQGR